MIKTVLLLTMLYQTPIDTTKFITPKEIIDQAAALEEEKNYEDAIALYKKVPENDTSFIEIQSLMMIDYIELEEYDEVIKIGNRIKGISSDFRFRIFNSLGNAYMRLGELNTAKDVYQEGVNLFPYQHILIYNLGLALFRLEKYDEAIEQIQRSARINPYYASNHILLGYIAMLEGHVTKSILSYITYLILSPGNNNALVFLNNIAKLDVRQEGSISAITDNTDFTYYDDLIRSGAALDERFKTKVELPAALVSQIELLLSKLEYDENSSDFWMQYYVPLYTQVEQKALTSTLIYFILTSIGNDDVSKWLEKHKTEKQAWLDLANTELLKQRALTRTTILGKEDEYSQWFYGNNKLSAIGNEIDDDTKTGPWMFFSQNGQLNAIGEYNAQGKKTGPWKYYHDNGLLSREEYYDNNGIFTKPAIYYHDNGAVAVIAHYDNENNFDGTLEYYYTCGQLKEIVPYTKGKLVGTGEYFYTTGELQTRYELKAGKLNGRYIRYTKSGIKESEYINVDDLASGPYHSFYAGGETNEIGQYIADSITGEWVGYYRNGNPSYKGSFKNGSQDGLWINYHDNGVISEESNYTNNKLDGESKLYDTDGILYKKIIYKEGKAIAITQFDKAGNQIYHEESPEGNMSFKSFFPTGELESEGSIKDGLLNGQYVKYYKNGIVMQKGTMKDNSFHGYYEEYFSTGQVYVKCAYNHGQLHGYYRQFYKTGGLEAEGWYINDEQEQQWYTYEPDGQIREEQYYINGKFNGWITTYAPINKKQDAYKYDMGIVTAIERYDTLGNIYHEAVYKYGNGLRTLLTVAGDTIFTGLAKCGEFIDDFYNYYPNGQIENHFTYEHSLFNGEYTSFDQDGTLTIKGDFKDGEKTGQWLWYHSNGQVRSNSTYKWDELNGEDTDYFYNGQVEVKSTYIDGKLNGPRYYYDQYGNLQMIKIYDRVDGFTKYINPQTNDTIPFIREGKFKLQSYFANGKLAVEQEFMNGFFMGVNKYYNADGTLFETVSLKYGDLDGPRIKYFSNGKIYKETYFRADMKHGTDKEYYENGNLRKEATYINDSLNGWVTVYDPEGKVIVKVYFWNDYAY